MSGNIANKSQASLLAAAYLGAVPVVADELAYAGVGEEQGVLKAGENSASWGVALDRLADPAKAAMLFERLDRWCHEEFDPEKARTAFATLDTLCLPGGAAARDARWQAACESQSLQQALPIRSPLRKAIARLGKSIRRRLAGLRRDR